MANDDQNADPEERIAQLEAALRVERARNAELQERVRALEGQQTKGSRGTGKPSWRRIVLAALTISVVPGLLCAYPVGVFIDHEDPVSFLLLALLVTLFLFVFALVLFRGIAPDYKELQERSDRNRGAAP